MGRHRTKREKESEGEGEITSNIRIEINVGMSMMSRAAFEMIDAGFGATYQDNGREGWRRFGVPTGGCMDGHAAEWANRLLNNAPDAVVVEVLFHGTKFRVLNDVTIAICGAATANVPVFSAIAMARGDVLELRRSLTGVWSYIAVESGFAVEPVLGSGSYYPRGKLGTRLAAGSTLSKMSESTFRLPRSVAGRSLSWSERRSYESPPRLRVWPGPQWELFAPELRDAFFAGAWGISSRSDRVGYRLDGAPLADVPPQATSEPMRIGTVQLPQNGLPIVIMRDGPTVGGYPKLGMIDPEDLPWLAQCRPGQQVRFQLAERNDVARGSGATHGH